MGKHLLVGFGGSGIHALRKFAKWVSQDYSIALRARDDFAFMLCDTDEDDLKRGEQDIRNALGKVVQDPIIRSLRLAHGVGDQRFWSVAQASFQRAAQQGDNTRISQSWWHPEESGTRKPFIAPTLETSVIHGAGQCPHVATFLAWKAADEDVVRRMVNEIIQDLQHRSHEPQSLTLSTYLVAGLSGGTGRGSWMPLGLEIAQHVHARGLQGDPQGFFFDATVAHDEGHQFIKQQVNSLTGVSELVGWLRNANNKQDPLHLSFPSFTRPQDAEADAISTRHIMGGRHGGTASPVQQAFVFGGNSKSGRVTRGDVYDMVGSAIFARISQTVLAREQINEGFQRLGSMGVASYWVPATELRHHLASRVKALMPNLLVREHKELCEERKKELLGDLRAWFADHDGSLLMKAVEDRISEQGRSFVDAFEASLRKQKREDATMFASVELPKVATEEKVDLAIDHALSMAFSVRDSKDASEAIRLRLIDKAHGLSLVDMKAILGAIRAELGKADKLAEQMQSTVLPNLQQKIHDCAKSVKYLGWGEVFDKAEITALRKTADDYIRALGKRNAAARLASRVKKLQAALASWSGTLANFIEHLSRSVEREDEPLKGEAEALFTGMPADGDTRQAALDLTAPEHDKLGERLVSRKLTPVLSAEELNKLVRETCVTGTDQQKVLGEILELAMKTSLGTRESAPTPFGPAIADRLHNALDRLAQTVRVDQFRLERSFSFVKVVAGLVDHWMMVVNSEKVRGDRVLQDEVARAFKRKFGYELKRDRTEADKFIVPTTQDVMVSMAIDLATTCDPMIQFPWRGRDVVKLFLPRDEAHQRDLQDLSDAINAERDQQERKHVKIGVDAERSNSSPFLMMAVSHAWVSLGTGMSASGAASKDEVVSTTLDEVTTFNYRLNGPVRVWLEAAEMPDGRTLRDKDITDFGQGTYGFGFVSPTFVHDDGWRKLRWRPWAKELENQVELKKQIHADAAVWALAMLNGKHLAEIEETVAGPLRDQFQKFENKEKPQYAAIGDFLRMAAKMHPGLAAGPYLIGPCNTGPRYRIARKLLHVDSVDADHRTIEVGTTAACEPIKQTGFDSLRKFLDFLSDPKNKGASEAILREKALVHGFMNQIGVCFNPHLVERQLAHLVETLITQEEARLRQAPEISLHKAALAELLLAAQRWVSKCQIPSS